MIDSHAVLKNGIQGFSIPNESSNRRCFSQAQKKRLQIFQESTGGSGCDKTENPVPGSDRFRPFASNLVWLPMLVFPVSFCPDLLVCGCCRWSWISPFLLKTPLDDYAIQ
jgi:hypothetical protein